MSGDGRVEVLQARVDEALTFHRLFLDDDSNLTPDARDFFHWLSGACEIHDTGKIIDQNGRTDAVAHVYRDGKAAVFRAFEKVMNTNIHHLQTQIQDIENEYGPD